VSLQPFPKTHSADTINEELNQMPDLYEDLATCTTRDNSPIDDDKIDVGDYFGSLVEDIKNCAESFEQSKIPMQPANENNQIRIPNPYMVTANAPSVQFDFTAL
jgi:ribosome recycling factor